MSRQTSKRRVGLHKYLQQRELDRLILGVLSYAARSDHWAFAGEPFDPYVTLGEITPGHVDGVIGLFNSAQWADGVLASGVPAVNTSNKLADQPLPRVGHDEEAIGRLGAEHLLGCGFARYGFIGWQEAWFSQRRMEAFCQTIADAGHPCDVLQLDDYDGPAVKASVRGWLVDQPKPIAVMTYSDHIGVALIEAAQWLRLSVPEQVAVLGVNNQWFATVMTRPPMSSIEMDTKQVGYQAAKMLDALMSGERVTSPQWVPPVGVVERRSTQVQVDANPLVTRALSYILEHCASGIVVSDVLDHVQVSRTTLETHLKRATGQTPQNLIFRAQIDRAKRLLPTSQDNLGQIARACGFERQDHFCTVFKRLAGVTPGVFRQQQRTR